MRELATERNKAHDSAIISRESIKRQNEKALLRGELYEAYIGRYQRCMDKKFLQWDLESTFRKKEAEKNKLEESNKKARLYNELHEAYLSGYQKDTDKKCLKWALEREFRKKEAEKNRLEEKNKLEESNKKSRLYNELHEAYLERYQRCIDKKCLKWALESTFRDKEAEKNRLEEKNKLEESNKKARLYNELHEAYLERYQRCIDKKCLKWALEREFRKNKRINAQKISRALAGPVNTYIYIDLLRREPPGYQSPIVINALERSVLGIRGFTPAREDDLRTHLSLQKWEEEELLMVLLEQELQGKEPIKKFRSMTYPRYLLEADRDRAHDMIKDRSLVAAIKTANFTHPYSSRGFLVRGPAKEKIVRALATYLIKKNRKETKAYMYKKLLAGNWPINRCFDALDASFTAYEVRKLKNAFCHTLLPRPIIHHILEYIFYDEDLCLARTHTQKRKSIYLHLL